MVRRPAGSSRNDRDPGIRGTDPRTTRPGAGAGRPCARAPVEGVRRRDAAACSAVDLELSDANNHAAYRARTGRRDSTGGLVQLVAPADGRPDVCRYAVQLPAEESRVERVRNA